jgi:hypothetical protein
MFFLKENRRTGSLRSRYVSIWSSQPFHTQFGVNEMPLEVTPT